MLRLGILPGAVELQKVLKAEANAAIQGIVWPADPLMTHDAPSSDAMKLVDSKFLTSLLGVVTSAPPALVATTIFLKQVGGELSKQRLHYAWACQALSTCWSMISFFCLLNLCSRWQSSSCRIEEAKQDLLCKSKTFLLEMGCLVETSLECEVLVIIIYCFVVNSFISAAAMLLGCSGLQQLASSLDGRNCHRHDEAESEPLLSELAKRG